MNIIGNLLWLVFGGLLIALVYFFVGVLFCLTIIGIPFGIQLFKLGVLALAPFGGDSTFQGGEPGCLSIFMNVLWILLGWWEVALMHLVFGIFFCITIIGIPFGIQHFKMMVLSAFPFGRSIVRG